MDKGNAPVFLAFLDERLRKAPVVLLFQSAEKGILGKPRLNDDTPLIAVAAGTCISVAKSRSLARASGLRIWASELRMTTRPTL